jgi:hypothetical protein
MKGFGFPTSAIRGGGAPPPYRADTSKHKSELITALTLSEKLWNEDGKQEESMIHFDYL